jgi:hypothetical protein
MKKLILALVCVVVTILSCTDKKPLGITVLGDGTPYVNMPEILVGKVKSVVEKNYWAIPDGDSYKKGSPLTKADRDSLGGWTDDFEVLFDENGLNVVCTGLNEMNKPIWKNESIIENKLVIRRNISRNDTLRVYDQFKYDGKGFLIGGTRTRAKVDTLMLNVAVKTNSIGYPTEYQLFNPKGQAIQKFVQTYDENNRFTKLEVFDKDGKMSYSYDVKYNDKSKVSELKIRDKDNKVTGSNYLTYEYDAMGNWVKAIIKDDFNRVVIEERTYSYFE